jgi:hypothetical protein
MYSLHKCILVRSTHLPHIQRGMYCSFCRAPRHLVLVAKSNSGVCRGSC